MQKRPVFIIVDPSKRDIEFIDPRAHEKDLKAKGEPPHDVKNQYDNMKMLYRDPHSVKDDDERKKDKTRGYHTSVFKYATDSDGIIEVDKSKKEDAKYVLRVMQQLSPGSYLDVRNGLSFDEVPDKV